MSLSGRVSALRQSLAGRVFLGLAGLATLVMWVTIAMVQLDLGDPDEDGTAHYRDWQLTRVHTRCYTFSFPGNLGGQVQPLIDMADGIHERVRTFLDSDMNTILVDGTLASRDHAGLAQRRAIRMNLVGMESTEALAAVLAHETAHVYAMELSGNRLLKLFNWTRCFNEGLATYIEYRFFHHEFETRELWFQAAAVHRRDDLDFEVVFDDNALGEQHDPALVYPLGFAFVSALVSRYGDRAPVAVLRAMNRPGAPPDLTGMAFWRDTFSACQMNVDVVINDTYHLLEEEGKAFWQEIEAVPRLYGALVETDEDLGVRPELSFEAEGDIHCRIRQSAGVDLSQYIYPARDEDGAFYVPRLHFPTLEFQLGFTPKDKNVTIYEPWVKVNPGR